MLKLPKITPKRFFILFCSFIFLLIYSPVFAADETPPETTHQFSGTLGDNGWYTSTVDVTLRVSDIESGPYSTTYWLNDDDPVTHEYSTEENPILNPSFENGDWWPGSIYYWDHNSGLALFWRSFLEHKFGWRSAATGIIGDGVYYWHNRDYAVTVIPGGTYTASGWIRTIELWGGTGAWFEVWAKGPGDMSTDVKITESYEKILGEADWQMLTRTFTAPSGYDKVYLRLCTQDTGFIGISFWDGVAIHGGYEASVNFTIVENGDHMFHYYSTDNIGNVEPTNNVPLKIDTAAPQDWQNFDQEEGANDHSFTGFIEVRDLTSGVDVSTGMFAYYTDHQDEGWDHDGDEEKDWYPVESVTRVDNGQPAADGYTGFVKLTTPETDFGNSATVMKFQFKIADMAGSDNLSVSPVMTLFGAWMQMEGKSNFYTAGGVSMSALPPVGEKNTDSLVVLGNSLNVNFNSEVPWILKEYLLDSKSSLAEFIPNYAAIRDEAILLPGNKLPETNGIYYYTGDYTIDQNSISSGFESATLSTIIIIEGDLLVKKEFSIQPDSVALFLVTGDIDILGQVSEVAGFFVTEQSFDTNVNYQGQTPLTINGSIVTAGQIILGRDLGRKGNPNNGDTPGEKIIFQPKYLMSQFLTDYLGSVEFIADWGEVGPIEN